MNIMTKKYLDRINNPGDLQKINRKELNHLAEEIRKMMICHISNNGGHLASNLGVVELTIALLRVFNPEEDKIIWDVGHQSYVYKILTGRKEQFSTIRNKNGIAGFPKRSESKYDFFNTGHSSTAISAALGYARAAKQKGENNYSIAVVGDGAMTGGMTFEAMNDAGASGDNIIVVLNDNEMSITRNVGGFAEYFSRMRAIRLYSGTNNSVKKGIEKIPLVGEYISKTVHRAKSAVKYLFSQNMLFEEMGFQYIGPVDGHDIKKLEIMMNNAKKIKGPVLLHVVTVKGKGYERAEKNPEFYHGVGSFNIDDGISEKQHLTFSDILGGYLIELAQKDEDISVVCPAVTLGCGLMEFSVVQKDKFIDVGIAEQHAVTLAAGMACGGLKPVVSGYSTFMQRAYDQILHDVCLMNLHVVFTFDRAGVVGGDGETHQGIYDLAYLGNMPNVKIYAPSSFSRLKKYIYHALYNLKSPVVIRYPKGNINLKSVPDDFYPDSVVVLKEGEDCVIFSYGKMLEEAFKAADILKQEGISCSVADLACLKPLDLPAIVNIIKLKKVAVCIEDVVESGSCSRQITYYLNKNNIDANFIGLMLPEKFQADGTTSDIIEDADISGKKASEIIAHFF